MKPVVDYTLYLVLDPEVCGARNPLEIAEQSVAGGASLIQLRASHWSKKDLFELAVALKKQLVGRSVPLLINNEIDIALACGAEGVHVGQTDLPVIEARRLLGNDAILGLSISTPEQMTAAAALPAGTIDYIGVGPAFPTTSKQNAAPALGVAGVAAIVARSPYPAVTIGGIGPEHAADLAKTGVQGLSVISAICVQPDPKKATEELRRAFLQGKSAS